MMSSLLNPFTVQTPEDIPAKEAYDLFVPVFGDFPKIPGPGHVFINGPRGCGKSMIFRYLQPDCQLIAKKSTSLRSLDFFSIYVPLKNCDLKLTELRRLEGQHASVILNEHFMVMYITDKTLDSLASLTAALSDSDCINAVTRYAHKAIELLRNCGYTGTEPDMTSLASVGDCFRRLQGCFESLFTEVIGYLRRLAFRTEVVPFTGPLCGYLDLLLPLLKELNDLPFMPGDGKPIYLLVDDADNLNMIQTRILNSWVSSRTSRFVSIKISTQMQYKTYRTVTGQSIDTPHDYLEVNISTTYTSRKRRYKDRVRDVVEKRLAYFGFDGFVAEDFFPADKEQENRIKEIAERYRAEWAEKGRGYRADDDAIRYARPDYMKSLAGQSKSSYNYSYSGFDQLVHISSGIIRFFLEAAAEMYGELLASGKAATEIRHIPPSIQNEVTRRQAEEFLFDDLEKLRDDESPEAPDEAVVTKLNRLVRSLGGLFRHILLSSRSERRVFSVAFHDEPSKDLREVFELGKQYGYFHESTIGNKDGTGRTRLYILSRRLAPLFNLDPTSFAGYLFLRSSLLDEAVINPDAFVRAMEKRIYSPGNDDVIEERQLALFE
jgi:hypothetical protein